MPPTKGTLFCRRVGDTVLTITVLTIATVLSIAVAPALSADRGGEFGMLQHVAEELERLCPSER